MNRYVGFFYRTSEPTGSDWKFWAFNTIIITELRASKAKTLYLYEYQIVGSFRLGDI